MPGYTLQDIDDLWTKGIISQKDRAALRSDFYQQSTQEEGVLRKFVSHLSQQVTDGWTGIRSGVGKAAKGAGPTAELEVVMGSLQLLGALATATGRAAGESVQDFLLKRGANQHVATLAAVISDIAGQTAAGAAQGAIIKAAGAPQRAATAIIKEGADNEAMRKGLMQWADEFVAADRQKAASAAKSAFDAAATKKAADIEAQTIIDSVNAKVKNLTATEKLLNKAAETVRGAGDEPTSTSATLEAAYQTLLGKKSAETIVNEMARRSEVKSAVRQLNKMADDVPIVRGGRQLKGTPETVGAFANARKAMEEGAARYEANKINMADLEAKAKASGTTIADVMRLQFGEPKTPQEIANLSQPIKFYGESFVKSVDRAEESLAKGDYSDFWQAMTEFHTIVESHWPYMAPRQVAGQALKTYDEPVLSATRFLQQSPRLASWMAKLKMDTPEEVEANASLILREMQKIKSPSEIANFGKRVAEELAEHGDEALADPTFRDRARFLFVNSLMSGTDTIGRNITGNVAGALWHYPEKLTSSIAAKALNPFLNAKHHLDGGYANEANVFMSTWARSMWDASRYALTRQWDEMRGLIPDEQVLAKLLDNRYDLKRFATSGTTNPFGGTFGKVVGTPVGIAQAADEVSRIALYRAAAGERLYRNWVSSGSKMPWGQYLDEGLANIPPSINEYAMKMAGEFTFSDKMSAFGRGISNLRELVPGSELIAPFVRTADRLTAFQYNRSPVLSLLSKRLLDEVNSGDATVRAEAIGRVVWANAVGAGLFVAAKTQAPDGMTLITGGGPTDRQLAGKLRDSKTLVPYSIWTPAGRLSFSGLAPIRGPLGLIADTAEVWDEIKNPNEASSLWDGISLGLSRNFFDMTYTKQLSDILQVWDNPSRSSSVSSRLAANVIKGFAEPSIVRQFMREIDPTVKESHDFWSELTREIPGYGGPPRRNPLTGEPVMNPPRLLSQVPGLGWFLPTSPIQPADDVFANKIRELKLKPPDFPDAFAGADASKSPFAYSGPLGEAREARSGVPIPKELKQKGMDYAFGAEDFGQTLNDEARAMVSDPEFNKLAPIDQAEAIRGLYHGRYSVAIERLKQEHPELLDAYELKMQQREAVRLPQEDRDAFERTERAQADVEYFNNQAQSESFSLLPEAQGEQ